MDLSQIQSDTDNDVHSLENADTAGDPPKPEQPSSGPPSGNTINQPLVPGEPGKKASLLKRLWRHLNIYLLLFLLVVMVAAGVTIFTALQSQKKNTDQDQITSQELSKSTLEQLANSDTTVGGSKQTLNVSSNAIFTGSVLMRNNLEIAGTVKIGGNLALQGITVSGESKLGKTQMDSLAVTGPATFQGALSASNGVNVTGKSTFGDISAAQLTTGTLLLNGDLKLTHHITAGGPIPSIARGAALGGGGTTSVSGSDTAGSIAISTGSSPPAGCFMTLSFQKAFANTPHIIISPIGSSAADLHYYVNRSTSNFSICTSNTPPAGATFGFDYLAVE